MELFKALLDSCEALVGVTWSIGMLDVINIVE